MNEQPHPPLWADRFLAWYCNPELLEEIQGDVHELYNERLALKGKRIADLFYIWDIIRFCRLSNIQRRPEFNEAGLFGLLWNINLKLALRNAVTNKLVFSVKIAALAVCMTFTLLLTALVINDTTYDHHYPDYQRLYRVGCDVDFQGKQSNVAVTPLPLGPTLADEVSGVEAFTRFMILPHASLRFGDKSFYGITSYAADRNFFDMFPPTFIEGTRRSLDEPNQIALTESVAYRIFGTESPLGKTIDLGWTEVEVTAVIRDLPSNSHFTFQALVSWETFDRRDEWTNINAYTYIRAARGADIDALGSAISTTAADYLKPLSDDYNFGFRAILQRIDEIHLSGVMDEDFATRRDRSYIYIIMSVIVLFLLSGLFNYLNLALTELTLQVKAIWILKAFGGYQANLRKIAFTEAVFSLFIAIPIVVLLVTWVVLQPGFFPSIDRGIWLTPVFLSFVLGIIAVVLATSGANGLIASRNASNPFPGRAVTVSGRSGLGLRKFLVASQLAFSIIMIGLIAVIIQQFRFIQEANLGFDASHVMVIRRPEGSRNNSVLENSIRNIPGVRFVAGSSYYPDGGIETKDVFDIETATGRKTLLLNFISGEKDYPELLGMRLVSGHFQNLQNESTGQPCFIINQSAAKLFGWKETLGKKIRSAERGSGLDGDVIGVVEDFHFESMHVRIEPLILVLNNGEWGNNFIYVKSDPLALPGLIGSMEGEYKKVYDDVPFECDHLDARYQSLYKNDQELKEIFDQGLIISVLVSALGIFSISALILSMRNKEMGIRKVVGAGTTHLFFLHLRPFGIFFLISAGIGLPFVFYLSNKWLANFAYHISLTPVYFILPVIGMSLIVFLASGYHAIRCSRINPVDILKEE